MTKRHDGLGFLAAMLLCFSQQGWHAWCLLRKLPVSDQLRYLRVFGTSKHALEVAAAVSLDLALGVACEVENVDNEGALGSLTARQGLKVQTELQGGRCVAGMGEEDVDEFKTQEFQRPYLLRLLVLCKSATHNGLKGSRTANIVEIT